MATSSPSPLDLGDIRRRLLERRRTLVGRVERMESALGDLEENRPAEEEEEAQETQLERPLVALDAASRAELDAVEAALARLSVGDYGTCARCGQPIEAERLRALPTTRLCADCADELDREARRTRA